MWEDCILGVNITKLARHDAISFYTYFWSRSRAATTSRRTKKFTYALTYNWKMTRGVFRDLENNALQNWAPDVSKVTLSPCTTNTLKHSFIVYHLHFLNIYFHIHNLKMSTDFFMCWWPQCEKRASLRAFWQTITRIHFSEAQCNMIFRILKTKGSLYIWPFKIVAEIHT